VIEVAPPGTAEVRFANPSIPVYTSRGMTRVGEDPDYYGLPYYEYTGPQAVAWLASMEESA
jgi:hypothetical protein